MANILWGIEIDTESAVSDASYGINNGFIRLATGRPAFDGSTTIPVGDNSHISITLSGAESIDVAFQSGQLYAASNGIFKTANTVPTRGFRFTILSGADFIGGELATAKGSAIASGDLFNVTDADSGSETVEYLGSNLWYNGFIVDSELGTSDRSIDIEKTGDYGTVSGFSFSIRNDNLPWVFFENNNIYLTGKRIRKFCIIDNVFYQVWDGEIRNNPRGEPFYKFDCIDRFRKLHDQKKLPPNVISSETFANVGTATEAEPIPICLGDVLYAKLQNVNFEPEVIAEHVPAKLYTSYIAVLGTMIYLAWVPELGDDPVNDLNVENLYLYCETGELNDLIKINAVDSDFVQNGIRQIVFLLDKGLKIDDDEFNSNNNIAFDNSLRNTTWYFKIITISFSGIISNKEIVGFVADSSGGITFNQWSKDDNRFIDLRKYIKKKFTDASDTDIKYPHIKYVSKSTNDNYDINNYVTIVPNIQSTQVTYSPSSTTFNASSLDFGIFTDLDRSTFIRYQKIGVSTGYLELRMTTEINPIILNTEFEKLYFAFDIERNIVMGAGTVSVKFVGYIDVPGVGTDTYETINLTPGVQYDDVMNYLPNEYYSDGNDDNKFSYFGQWDDNVGDEVALLFELDENFINKLRLGIFNKVDVIFKWRHSTSNLDVSIKQFGFVGLIKANLQNDENYTKVNGEYYNVGNAIETNSVYNAFRHILENYDGIHSDFIDYGNLSTCRSDWHLGRQITNRKNSLEYLKELCKESFVAIAPGRTGKRLLSCWIEDNTTAFTHNGSVINDKSIAKFEQTSMLSLWNNFEIKYNWHPGFQKYTKSFVIQNVEQDAFPGASDVDSNGNLLWPQYVSGLNIGSYASAKAIWDICHDSFLQASTALQPSKEYSELNYFIDTTQFDSALPFFGVLSSAWKYLENVVDWNTHQKLKLSYDLPIIATNVVLELLDKGTFEDYLYTNAIAYNAWISRIRFEPQKEKIKLNIIIEPQNVLDSGLIIERGAIVGSADDTITERGAITGAGDDTITEG